MIVRHFILWNFIILLLTLTRLLILDNEVRLEKKCNKAYSMMH